MKEMNKIEDSMSAKELIDIIREKFSGRRIEDTADEVSELLYNLNLNEKEKLNVSIALLGEITR